MFLPEPRTYQGHGWTLPGPNGVMGGKFRPATGNPPRLDGCGSTLSIAVDPCNNPPIPTPSWGYHFSRAIQSYCPFRSLYHPPLPSSRSKPYPSIRRPQLATPLRKLREISVPLRTRCRRPINPHVVCGSLVGAVGTAVLNLPRKWKAGGASLTVRKNRVIYTMSLQHAVWARQSLLVGMGEETR